jgi:hypothetical protein
MIGVAALALASCMQATTTIAPSQADPPPKPEPATESKPEEQTPMKLQPIPAYPAYYREDAGSVYGIPASLQGTMQKEKIDVLQDDGSPAPVTDMFIKGGVIYLTAHYFTRDPDDPPADPVEHTDYFSQMLGSQTIESIASIPGKPNPKRVVINLAGFTIEENKGVSEIWNTFKDFIEPGCPKGCGPFRYPMVQEYAQQENGLLFCTGDELLFIPQKRTATNVIAEAGRLWK